jgi:glycosyltransferase involved in cell wall biosynthesis
MNLSVIICTHNPRPHYIARTLEHLEKQTLAREDWELLLIDNHSADPLEARINLTWHPNARHVRENTLGLTPARLRGIRESICELLVFVDDDNLLDPDYLENAIRISSSHPFLGAWGGSLIPEYEVVPPEWANPHVSILALRKVETKAWSNIPDWSTGTCPAGAGMCIRADIARTYLRYCSEDARRYGMDRKGSSLISAGDLDMAFTSCDLNLGVGVFPQLSLLHIIPAARLDMAYLLRLNEAHGISNVILGSFRGKLPPKPDTTRRSFLGRTRNRLIEMLTRKSKHYEIHKRFSEAYSRGIILGYEMIQSHFCDENETS